MVIVDSSVWVDFFRGTSNRHTVWLERELTAKRLGITDLILCEVLQGVRPERLFRQIQQDLRRCQVFPCVGEEIAVASAQNYRRLQAEGHTIRKTIDCLIATFCLAGNHALLHRDHDFDAFEKYLGLEVIHPREA